MTFPSTSTVPFSGSSKPKIISTIVVFPLPVAPTSPIVDLEGMFKLTSYNDGFDEFG